MLLDLLTTFNSTASHSSSKSTLVCPGYPIELFPGYTKAEDFSVTLSILDNDNANVLTQCGKPYMAMGVKRRGVLYDCYGFPIVNIQRKRNSFFGGYQVFDGEYPESEPLLTITRKWPWAGSTMTVSMTNCDKELVQLTAKRHICSRRRKVIFEDLEVGHIRPGPPRGTNSSGRVSYTISSAPYVDIVLLVVIALCLNDRYRYH